MKVDHVGVADQVRIVFSGFGHGEDQGWGVSNLIRFFTPASRQFLTDALYPGFFAGTGNIAPQEVKLPRVFFLDLTHVQHKLPSFTLFGFLTSLP